MLGKQLQTAAAGAAAGDVLGVEDVFSTWLYTGNGSTQTITNGIDLAGEGGLVWIKNRNLNADHALCDTERGVRRRLCSNDTSTEFLYNNGFGITNFNGDGFSLGGNWDSRENSVGRTYASWTFRKAEKFFDVVTWVGDDVNGRAIPHNLGSVPGCIIIKASSAAGSWWVYHRSQGTGAYGILQLTNAFASYASVFTSVTSTDFVPTTNVGVTAINTLGVTYVAYLFAHDAGGFGDGGTESVIKCGSYTGTSSYQEINLGWEAQWVLIKKATSNNSALRNWFVFDNMRGATVDGATEFLKPNLSDTPSNFTAGAGPAAVGFNVNSGDNFNTSGETYIYIAIRRGPMKTPTDATTVFHAASGIYTTTPITTGFPLDLGMYAYKASDTYKFAVHDRLRGLSSNSTQVRYGLITSSTAAENPTLGTSTQNVTNTSYDPPGYFTYNDSLFYSFRRAPGFFDVVAYTGTGSARTVSHNLGVVPELMITKSRTTARQWGVYASSVGATKYLMLQDIGEARTGLAWNDTTPTATVFSVGPSFLSNESGQDYIAYLFATCPGVSKVGSYTGTGTTLSVDCGFASGARFVMIKRTDVEVPTPPASDWYVWDTARGIVSGNDPYLLLNSTAAEVTSTDYIDPLSTGFQISSTAPAAINANGGSYIFLAIA